ncbi:MAG: DUF3846 domain-containing protein [Erysipelotrichaceae bacterium]|nr:DUF3846 domain-containing protein [Erysipelotrichaceae bacterium]
MIRGILVKPGYDPEIIEFREGYRELQKLVEGNFEIPHMFPDVDIVINEEGKLNGSDMNKFLYHHGKLVDVIFGNIVIVDSDEDGKTISLSQDKIDKYLMIFCKENINLK